MPTPMSLVAVKYANTSPFLRRRFMANMRECTLPESLLDTKTVGYAFRKVRRSQPYSFASSRETRASRLAAAT